MKTIYLLMLSVVTWELTAKEIKVNNSSRVTPVTRIASGCATPTAQMDISINNVRARIFTGGDMWWDLVQGGNSSAQYEVPKGSGKTPLYAGSIWIGGYDGSGNLKVAAQSYRQSGRCDYFAGPISLASGSPDISASTCNAYDRFWNVTRAQVQDFVINGVTTPDILSWPGNGNIANGELPMLAPFEDVNGDGIYNTSSGDYPRYNLTNTYLFDSTCNKLICDDYIFGDQTLWWVFNDVGNTKTETNSPPIGIEIRAQAFEFATSNGVNNCSFYKYQIINRNNSALNNTFLGSWTDPDLGDAFDDYIGCDVMRGLGYCYNGDNDDGSGTPEGYGIAPPAIGIDFLQGPLADVNDSIDNNKNGTIDEPCERISMSKFMTYLGTANTPYSTPSGVIDYYLYMSGFWKNNNPFTFDGATGFSPPGPGSPPCSYLFPGNTDPDFPGSNWTELTANNLPDDSRFLMSVGAFTLLPGEVDYVTTSVMWVRGSSNFASVDDLKLLDDTIQSWFNTCFTVYPTGINDINSDKFTVDIAPNPFSDKTSISFPNKKNEVFTLCIYDSKGSLVETQTTSSDSFLISGKNKTSGLYFYELKGANDRSCGKLIVK